MLAVGLLLTVAAVAATTNPATQWNAAGNGVLMPVCASGGPKHWSVLTDNTPSGQALVWDAFKVNSYSNLRLDAVGNGVLVMSGDCTLGT